MFYLKKIRPRYSVEQSGLPGYLLCIVMLVAVSFRTLYILTVILCPLSLARCPVRVCLVLPKIVSYLMVVNEPCNLRKKSKSTTQT